MDNFDCNVDFNKYKVFLAVAECKSFSKATEYLHISQPAISHAIKELEEQLNTKLLIRNTKNVALTDDGEKIKFYVKSAFDNISLGEQLLKEKNNDLIGVIRVGIYSHIALFMLPDTIYEFRCKYPNAKFSIYTGSHGDMIEKLKKNELDCIVMQYPIFINDNKFKEEIICSLDTCFFANKYYYDLYSSNHELIKNFPLILPLRGFPDIDKLEETLKKHNLVLKHNFTSYATELTKEFTKEGIGIGWGIRECIKQDLNNKNLYELPFDFELPITTFSIAYDEGLLNKTTKEFIMFFKEKINDKYNKRT